MDAFVNVLKDFSNQIIPILGAVCLICLIVFLIKLIKLLGNVEITVTKTNGTIDLVDESIEKIQAPLDTVVKLSDTIDKAHGATLDATKEVKDFVTKTTTDVKDKILEIITEDDVKKLEEKKAPAEEDTIGV